MFSGHLHFGDVLVELLFFLLPSMMRRADNDCDPQQAADEDECNRHYHCWDDDEQWDAAGFRIEKSFIQHLE